MSATATLAVRYQMPDEHAPLHLPTPRLQLRWEEALDDREYRWRCHYELVWALRPFDARNDQEDGPAKTAGVAVVALGVTRIGCDDKPWQTARVRDRRPYRDGAHSSWDAEALGGLPVYVLAPDMEPARVPSKDAA